MGAMNMAPMVNLGSLIRGCIYPLPPGFTIRAIFIVAHPSHLYQSHHSVSSCIFLTHAYGSEESVMVKKCLCALLLFTPLQANNLTRRVYLDRLKTKKYNVDVSNEVGYVTKELSVVVSV